MAAAPSMRAHMQMRMLYESTGTTPEDIALRVERETIDNLREGAARVAAAAGTAAGCTREALEGFAGRFAATTSDLRTDSERLEVEVGAATAAIVEREEAIAAVRSRTAAAYTHYLRAIEELKKTQATIGAVKALLSHPGASPYSELNKGAAVYGEGASSKIEDERWKSRH